MLILKFIMCPSFVSTLSSIAYTAASWAFCCLQLRIMLGSFFLSLNGGEWKNSSVEYSTMSKCSMLIKFTRKIWMLWNPSGSSCEKWSKNHLDDFASCHWCKPGLILLLIFFCLCGQFRQTDRQTIWIEVFVRQLLQQVFLYANTAWMLLPAVPCVWGAWPILM